MDFSVSKLLEVPIALGIAVSRDLQSLAPRRALLLRQQSPLLWAASQGNRQQRGLGEGERPQNRHQRELWQYSACCEWRQSLTMSFWK